MPGDCIDHLDRETTRHGLYHIHSDFSSERKIIWRDLKLDEAFGILTVFVKRQKVLLLLTQHVDGKYTALRRYEVDPPMGPIWPAA